MKKITITAIAFTVIFGVQLLTPNQSEAGMTCKTNYLGQVICTDSNDYFKINMHVNQKDTAYHMVLLGWVAERKLNKDKEK